MIKIAIPQLDDSVAPRFEAARSFLIAETSGGQILSTRIIECDGPEGYRRIRMLQIHRATVLICNGINSSYRDMLTVSGVTVVPKVSGRVDYALGRYLEGKLLPEENHSYEATERCAIPHTDLVNCARRLFEAHGYVVTLGPGPDSFLIDLVAEIPCPVCDRRVKVAICCGAHTYRADQEITEFHHATPTGYNARVYVSPPTPPIEKCCREYGIQLVDPAQVAETTDDLSTSLIPLLSGPVTDHEQATQGANNG